MPKNEVKLELFFFFIMISYSVDFIDGHFTAEERESLLQSTVDILGEARPSIQLLPLLKVKNLAGHPLSLCLVLQLQCLGQSTVL